MMTREAAEKITEMFAGKGGLPKLCALLLGLLGLAGITAEYHYKAEYQGADDTKVSFKPADAGTEVEEDDSADSGSSENSGTPDNEKIVGSETT